MERSLPHASSQCSAMETEESPLLGRKGLLQSRRETVALSVSTGLMMVIGGIYICSSYLAKPVQATCQSWSSSATVWGIALMLVGDGVTGFLVGPFVVRQNIGSLVVLGTLCGASAFGVGGVAVLTCERSPLVTEIVYVAHFGVVGLMVCVQYLCAIQMLFHRFPWRKGAVGGFIATCSGIGSIGLGQLLSWLQELSGSGSLPAGAIFFILGLMSISLSLPCCVWVCLRYSRSKNDAEHETDNNNREDTQVCRRIEVCRCWGEVLKTPQFVILFCAYFFTLFTGWGMISHLDSLLNWLWMGEPTPMVLSLVATSSYAGGRVLWALTADRLGVQNAWRLCSLVQAVLMSLLPWVATVDKTWSRYAAVSMVCFDLVFFSGPKVTTGAFASIVFPGRLTRTAIGLMVLAFDLSGALGPLVCEAMFRRYDSYTEYLMGLGWLPLVSTILLFFLQPVKARPVKTGPAKTGPAKTEPVKTGPVKTVPVKTVPVKTVPVKTVPVKTEGCTAV